MFRFRAALTLAASATLALSAAAPANAKTSLRIQKSTETVTIPTDDTAGNVFDDAQHVGSQCRSNEKALSPGILDSPRHFATQSFGPSALSGFAVGAPGTVKVRTQLLCARGAKVQTKRVPGKTFPAAGSRSLTSTATAKCPGGGLVLGAPLSQDYFPVTGAYSAKPTSTSTWEVRAEGIPSSYPFQQSVPTYADVACVSKRNVSKVKQLSETTDGLTTGTTASVRLKCTGGRRALGWGVELRPFARFSSPRVAGGATIPFVRKAVLSKSSVNFVFELPEGAAPSATATQTAYVTCAKVK